MTKIGIHGVSRTLSRESLEKSIEKTLRSTNLAICLHRITDSDSDRTKNPLTITSKTLKELLSSLNRIACGSDVGKLTITFDDGYMESLEFIQKNQSNYPNLSWIYFICPEKSIKNEGFEWDPPNKKAELSSIERCFSAHKKHSIKIGNHTNSHRSISTLSNDEIINEIQLSIKKLKDHNIDHTDFAFPYGYPNVHFTESQSTLIKNEYSRHSIDVSLWSTEPYPYPAKSNPIIIPRIPILGTEDSTSSLSKILMQSIKLKIRNLSTISRT